MNPSAHGAETCCSRGSTRRAASTCRGSRTHAVSRLGLGDHAAADAGGDGDPVLRALHASASPTSLRSPRRPSTKCCILDRPRLLRARAQSARAAQRIVSEHRRRFPATLEASAGAAGHRPLDRGRDPRAVALAAASDSRWQREARAGALLRRRRAFPASRRSSRRCGGWPSSARPPSASRTTRRRSWISARRCACARARCARVSVSATLRRAHARVQADAADAAAEEGAPATRRLRGDRATRRRSDAARATTAGGIVGRIVDVSAIRRSRCREAAVSARRCAYAAGMTMEAKAKQRGMGSGRKLPPHSHAFTHFDLTLHPVVIKSRRRGRRRCRRRPVSLVRPAQPAKIGLAKPAVDLIRALQPIERTSAGVAIRTLRPRCPFGPSGCLASDGRSCSSAPCSLRATRCSS